MALIRRAVKLSVLSWLVWRVLGPEIPRRAASARRPLHIPGRTVFVGDREFFVRESGPEDAPPIVLLHGWSFDAEMTFFNLIPALAERFRVIAPDNRGHGRSDWTRGRYEIADVADDAAGIIDALGIDAPIVFGYSMGGMVAQELARRHPGKISGVILAATAAHPIPSDLGFRIVLLIGRAITRISRKEFSTASTKVLTRSGALDTAHATWMWEGLMRRDANLYYEAGSAVRRFDSRPWIGDLRVPAMVIVNSDDQIVPTRLQIELASHFTDEDVAVIESGRHESVMNRADEYVKLIAEFADR